VAPALTLFDPPQPVAVIAGVPDGPPQRFRWRRKVHEVRLAEGPERIAPEWWRRQDGHLGKLGGLTRDYYRIEDSEGRRYWMFRHGLFDEKAIRAGSCTACSHDPPSFAEPVAASNFSFLRGASSAEAMVGQAHALGMAGIGIADRNTVAGVVRAHRAWKQVGGPGGGFRLIVGARLVFADGTPDVVAYPTTARLGPADPPADVGNRRAEKGSCHLTLTDLLDHCEDMALIAMDGDAALLRTLRQATPHLWLAVAMPRAGRDARLLARRLALATQTGVPPIASNDALYATADTRPLHDVLTCIREGRTLQPPDACWPPMASGI
jgi:hypothetical protein